MSATSPQLRQREHATKSVLQTEAEMIKAIREAGRTPMQRNTLYEPIKLLPDASAANEAEPPRSVRGLHSGL
jgi:2-iminoacetate synthase ThiH